MGSVDIPPFLRDKQKAQLAQAQQEKNAVVPPFLKKKDGTELDDGSTPGSPSTSPSKSTSVEDISDVFSFDRVTKGGAPTPPPPPKTDAFSFDRIKPAQKSPLGPVKEGAPATSKATEQDASNVFTFDEYTKPQVQLPDGSVASVNPRALPVPYTNARQYAKDFNERKAKGALTPQDESFVKNNTKANLDFTAVDNSNLNEITRKYGIDLSSQYTDDLLNAVKQAKDKIRNYSQSSEVGFQASSTGTGTIKADFGKAKGDSEDDVQKLNDIERRLLYKKSSEDTMPIYDDVAIRTDNSGNNLKKFLNRIALFNPTNAGAGQVAISQETQDAVEKQPAEFSIGLNLLKYSEPEQYKRVVAMLQNKEPLSASVVANITAQGIDSKEYTINQAFATEKLSEKEYMDELDKLQKTKFANLVGNKETYRSFLANGVAELADADNVATEGMDPKIQLAQKVFGHRWSYDDNEIERYAKAYAQANGIDPENAETKQAIKYLQENEGAMIMENSIAKTGLVRDLAKGLAQPIRGISNTIEDIGKTNSDIYNEGQSQGSANVSEQRVKRLQHGWEGAVSDVMEGTGQFLTQAGIAALTSGAIGAGAAAMGGEVATAAAGAGTAAESVGMSAKIGTGLFKSKDAISTFITSYAQAYDNNLKQALTYTADNTKAQVAANILSGLEGATELWLSPLEIAQGIKGKLFGGKDMSKGLIAILNDAAIVDKNAAVKNFLKASMKGGLETGKVILSEIGEENVTQAADYATNAVLNPDSRTFQKRSLASELAETSYKTGLSMVIPAIMSGVGSFKANNFSKGSLLVAAQNRQHFIDQINSDFSKGLLTEEEKIEKSLIVNTASAANSNLPVTASGKKLNSQDKADYVYSRVTEGILAKQLDSSTDEAEKSVLEKKIKDQQEFRKGMIGRSDVPVYKVDGKEVSKEIFDIRLNSKNVGNFDLEVTNDNDRQEQLRKIGGEDQDNKTIVSVNKNNETENTQAASSQSTQSANASQSSQENTSAKEGEETNVLNNDAAAEDNAAASLLAKAKDIVNTDVVKGYTAPVLREAAENKTEEFNGMLKEIAEQAQDPNSLQGTINTYGQELVDIANQLHPAKNAASSTASGEELSKIEEARQADLSEVPDNDTKKRAEVNEFYDNQIKEFSKNNPAPKQESQPSTVSSEADLKNTKVVDENNKPLTVYHGSKEEFTDFDESKKGATDEGWWGSGFYFHTDKNRGGYGDIVKSANIDLKNPIDLPVSESGKHLYDIVGEKAGLDNSFRDKSAMAIIKEIGSEKFTELAKELGYDGVIVNYAQGTKEIVAFDKNSIKNLKSENKPAASEPASQPSTVSSEGSVVGGDVIENVKKNKELTLTAKQWADIVRSNYKNVPHFDSNSEQVQSLKNKIEKEGYKTLKGKDEVRGKINDKGEFSLTDGNHRMVALEAIDPNKKVTIPIDFINGDITLETGGHKLKIPTINLVNFLEQSIPSQEVKQENKPLSSEPDTKPASAASAPVPAKKQKPKVQRNKAAVQPSVAASGPAATRTSSPVLTKVPETFGKAETITTDGKHYSAVQLSGEAKPRISGPFQTEDLAKQNADKVLSKEYEKNNSSSKNNNDGPVIAESPTEQQLAEQSLSAEDNPEQEPVVKNLELFAENTAGKTSKELSAAEKQAVELVNAATNVVNVPIASISTNEKEYQGRKNKFSEVSAKKVAENFDPNKLDPIIIYKHPDGKTYVLSGHSRFEGMTRRGEKTIPARYFEGTPQEAVEFALKSNKLGTLQTDIENAAYYREQIKKGAAYDAVLKEAKANEQEGTAKRIVSLAHLNPNGKAMQGLEALERGEGDTKNNILNIAQKIGDIRAKNPHLTNAHENELFDYMAEDNKNIPTDKDIVNQTTSLNRSIATVKFDPNEPLNLNKLVLKSPARMEWEKTRADLEKQLTDLKAEVNPSKKTGWTGLKERAIGTLAAGNKSAEAIDKATADFEANKNGVKDNYQKVLEKKRAEMKAVSDKLAKHLLQEKNVIEGDKAQTSLFSSREAATDFETKDKAPATVKSLREKYPDAVVVQSQSQLPEQIRKVAEKSKITVEGVFHDGKVYMVADNLSSMGRAEGVYRHETIGHKGVIAELKGRLNTFVSQMLDNATEAQKPAFEKVSQLLYNKGLAELTAQEKNIVGQEYIAMAAENPAKYATTWQKVVSFVKDFLRDLGIKLSVSDKDIQVLLDRAAKQTAAPTAATRFSVNGVQYETMPDSPSIVDGFYSPIEKKVIEEKANNLSATKWLERFGKGDEVQFTGLRDFLESKKPNEQVSKKQIYDFIKNNRIQIVEVQKGGSIDDFLKKTEEAERKFGVNVVIEENDMDGSPDVQISGEKLDGMTDEEVQELQDQVTDFVMTYAPETTYHQYQLEGEKGNYKEVLITIPRTSMDNAVKLELERLESIDYNERTSEQKERISELNNQIQNRRGFKSSHYTESNIVAHLRMNTRQDADGNTVLFLEEIQSDWNAAGRKHGFDLSTSKESIKAVSDYNKKQNENKEFKDKNFDKLFEGKSDVIAKLKEIQADLAVLRSKLPSIAEVDDSGFANMKVEKNVPAAPFVTDTNKYVKLALKIAMQHAVNEGATKIAWTTGEQQNDRYDLSKQVDEVRYKVNDDETYNVYPIKNGESVLREADTVNLSIQQVEDILGKDVAQKIENGEGAKYGSNFKKLSPNDLRIGGKGMIGFYGSANGTEGIVGKVAKALIKEVTGKAAEIVSTKMLGEKSGVTTDIDAIWVEDNGKLLTKDEASKYKFNSNETVYAIDNYVAYRLTDVQDIYDARNNEIYVLPKATISNQQSIEITPELKAKIGAGIPLFSAKQNSLPENLSTYADDIIAYVKEDNPNATADDVIKAIDEDKGTADGIEDSEAEGVYDYVRSQFGEQQAAAPEANDGGNSEPPVDNTAGTAQDSNDDDFLKSFDLQVSGKTSDNASIATLKKNGYNPDMMGLSDQVEAMELDLRLDDANRMVSKAKEVWGDDIAVWGKKLYQKAVGLVGLDKNLDASNATGEKQLVALTKLRKELNNEFLRLTNKINFETNKATQDELKFQRSQVHNIQTQVNKAIEKIGNNASRKLNLLRMEKAMDGVALVKNIKNKLTGETIANDFDKLTEALNEEIGVEETGEDNQDLKDKIAELEALLEEEKNKPAAKKREITSSAKKSASKNTASDSEMQRMAAAIKAEMQNPINPC